MEKYKIKELRGIDGYQFMQVIYFLLRAAYYTPELNSEYRKIEDFFAHIGELEGDELNEFCGKVAVLGADISKDYWNIILRSVECSGRDIIPESIVTIPVDELLYIISEGLKKVLSIKLPFWIVRN